METSFELIREAGLRVPTPLGTTIGIVGALILFLVLYLKNRKKKVESDENAEDALVKE